MYKKTYDIIIIIVFLVLLLVAFIPFGECKTEAQEDFERAEKYWLTMNIYHESRGEEPLGMFLVALVTLDRQNDGRWGDTIKSVVTYPHQFSWYSDGKSDIPTNEKSWDQSKGVAFLAKMTYSIFGEWVNLTHYHNKTVDPQWSWEMERALAVGNHIFYREI